MMNKHLSSLNLGVFQIVDLNNYFCYDMIEVIMITFNNYLEYKPAFPLKKKQYYEEVIDDLLSEYPSKYLVHTCTAALEIMALALGIEKGDEVILPSFTFVSTANAFALRGATLIFADVDDHMNLNLNHVKSLMTPKTKAIVAVHYGGASCDLNALKNLCLAHDVFLLEDAAQGLKGTHLNQPLGTFGTMACISFHQTKNIHCFEGGLLIVNDDRFIRTVETIIDEGTDRQAFFQNKVSRYTWKQLGSSYAMDVLRMAYLVEALKHADVVTQRRRAIVINYQKKISSMKKYEHPEHNGHLFYVLTENRDQFIHYMTSCGIECLSHYEPLHESFAGRTYGCASSLPQTKAAHHLVRLPVHNKLSDDEVDYIIECVEKYNG